MLLEFSWVQKASSNWRGVNWERYHKRDKAFDRHFEEIAGLDPEESEAETRRSQRKGQESQKPRGLGGREGPPGPDTGMRGAVWAFWPGCLALKVLVPPIGLRSAAKASILMIECALPPAVLRDSGFPQLPVTVTNPRPPLSP